MFDDDNRPAPIPAMDYYPCNDRAPDGLFAVVVFNDGRFEVFEPARPGDCTKWDTPRRRFGAFIEARYAGGTWRGGPKPRRLRWRVVFVHGCSSYTVDDYAADLAAQFTGRAKMLKARLERGDDGRFHCPHCGAEYKSATPFSGHLLRDCNDQGAARYTGAGEFVDRNGRLTRPIAA